MLKHNLDGAIASEWNHSGQRFEHQASERINVRARTESLTTTLLRTHVSRTSNHFAGLGQLLVIDNTFDEPEICQFRLLGFTIYHHIAWFYVRWIRSFA